MHTFLTIWIAHSFVLYRLLMQSSDFASKILKTGIIHLCHRIPSGNWSFEMMRKCISIASAFCWVNSSACGTFAESKSWLFSVCFDLWTGLECYCQDFSFYILSLLWFCGLRNVGSFPWFSWILQHCWLPGGETQTEEALYDLPWKDQKGPLWIRPVLELIQKQHWGNFGEMGWSL